MGANDILIKEVTAEINALCTGFYGEVIFEKSLFADIPDLECFMDPRPDIWTQEGLHGQDDQRIEHMLAENVSVLGLYIPMRSPGVIILARRNLRQFFWSLVSGVHRVLPYLTPGDLQGVLQLAISKTYQHELFHYRSDVLRQMFGGPFDPLLEEALAVAWSRLWILNQDGRSLIGKMNRVCFQRVIKMGFEYRSPGYRDWPKYGTTVSFKAALLGYVAPSNYQQLQANGVEMEEIVLKMLESISGGCTEKVV